jgi:type I restriction enzyme S subunit
MAADMIFVRLRDLLITTKDGDWGRESSANGFLPYRVIRGADFPSVRIGDTSSVPIRYLNESTVQRRILEPGDILLETAGGSPKHPTGRSLLITDRLLNSLDLPATCASFARFLRVDRNKADPLYIYWYLQYLYASGRMDEHQVQHTGVARFQYTKFAESQLIPLLSRKQQRAIANILGALDDKIELNRRMNETLEAMVRALFKSWFVDFDPVRAKTEGRDMGLPKYLSDLFSDRFVDSEMGEIPEGWKIRSLDEIAHFINGLALQKYPPKDRRWLPVIKIAQLRAGNSTGADRASADLEPDYIIQNGDILFSWSGSLECVLWAGGPGALNQHLFKVIPEKYPRWLCYLGIHKHLEDFRNIAAGKATTMGHIKRQHLSDAKLPVPSQELLHTVDTIIQSIFECTWQRKVQSHTLTALRDTLLPKLLSSELRVKDAERIMRRNA